MQNAILVANIFGPILFILGVWVLARLDQVIAVWTTIKAMPGLLYLSGFINLLIGFTVISLYKEWTPSLAVLVTIFGYLQILRGLVIYFCHAWIINVVSKMMRHPSVRLLCIIPILWGLALCIFAWR